MIVKECMAAHSPSDDLSDVARRLAKLARSRDTRVVPKNLPCDWRPQCIISPISGAYFTTHGAWDFIADLLDQGFPITEKTMDVPPGSIGYEMAYASELTTIYIKVQFGHGVIIGRSFHPPYYDLGSVRSK
jgi:hypothetical protein